MGDKVVVSRSRWIGKEQLIGMLASVANIAGGSIGIKYVGTWAGKPALTSADNKKFAYFSDKPNAQGGWFTVRESSGTPGTYIYDRVGGGPIVEDTYANIVTNYAAATYSGCKAWATNGSGYEVRSDGTNWIVQLYQNVTTTLSSSSGVVTIDCRSGQSRFSLALTENVTSWSFTNLPTTGRYRDIYVEITQHASSAKACASPASPGKTAGFPWVVSPTLSAVEVLGMRIFSDGTVHLYPSGVMS